jgi:hypothetical protein
MPDDPMSGNGWSPSATGLSAGAVAYLKVKIEADGFPNPL